MVGKTLRTPLTSPPHLLTCAETLHNIAIYGRDLERNSLLRKALALGVPQTMLRGQSTVYIQKLVELLEEKTREQKGQQPSPLRKGKVTLSCPFEGTEQVKKLESPDRGLGCPLRIVNSYCWSADREPKTHTPVGRRRTSFRFFSLIQGPKLVF